MINIARIFGVVAAFLAGVLVKFAADHGLTLDAEEVTLTMTTIMLAVYAAVHRLTSKRTNPPDAATSEVKEAIEANTGMHPATKSEPGGI